LNVEEWFPTLIYHDIIDIDGLEKLAYKMQKNSEGRVISNRGGWQSNNLSDNTMFKKLIDMIEKKAIKVHDTVYKQGTGEYKLTNIWININHPNSHNACHIHPEADICGNMYVKTPENCGNLYFDDPRLIHRMNESYNNNIINDRLTYKQVAYTPAAGIILFFPPWIQHGVEPNMSNEDRISIAFNMSYISVSS
jgi:uncharacterized protein (TIGR02466 family)